MKKEENCIIYLVDDMTTGSIIVQVKLDEPEANTAGEEILAAASEIKPEFVEGQYVKIYGVVKTSNEATNYVEALRIMPVKELNEITNHILECMDASIYVHTKAKSSNLDFLEPHVIENPLQFSNLNSVNYSTGLSTLQNQVRAKCAKFYYI